MWRGYGFLPHPYPFALHSCIHIRNLAAGASAKLNFQYKKGTVCNIDVRLRLLVPFPKPDLGEATVAASQQSRKNPVKGVSVVM